MAKILRKWRAIPGPKFLIKNRENKTEFIIAPSKEYGVSFETSWLTKKYTGDGNIVPREG